jgi:hypothetical protein
VLLDLLRGDRGRPLPVIAEHSAAARHLGEVWRDGPKPPPPEGEPCRREERAVKNQFPPSRLSARHGVQKRDRRRDAPKRARRADGSRGLLEMKY